MELAERPMRFVRKQMKEKHYASSYVSMLYEKTGEKTSAEDEELIKWTAASMYAAGADTVSFLFDPCPLVLSPLPELAGALLTIWPLI